MSVERELADLRERVVKLEVKVDEMSKRLDALSNYAKELYQYIQRLSRPLI
ncbi:MAG: hypothetical protein QXO01_07185 [Nitrososphaerota archaeon]